jgi:cytochrome c-type protein NapB
MCCKTGESIMDTSKRKPMELLLLFAGICAIAVPVIIFSALPVNSAEALKPAARTQNLDFDHNGQIVFQTYDDTTEVYMEGNSTSRTLADYYSLRQYPGSPPYIDHALADEKGQPYECLSCHKKGGFTQSLNRYAPVTPHPRHIYCMQCHVKPVTDELFKEIDWVSVMLPLLGRSALPGSPPPVAHSLQMRENCIACHVGPGTVVTIRVEHPMRGNCRQCHVPEVAKDLFEKNKKNDQ